MKLCRQCVYFADKDIRKPLNLINAKNVNTTVPFAHLKQSAYNALVNLCNLGKVIAIAEKFLVLKVYFLKICNTISIFIFNYQELSIMKKLAHPVFQIVSNVMTQCRV